MRVLFAIESLRTGGKERQLIELLKGLKKQPAIQFEVMIMSDRVDYDAFATLDVPHHILVRKSPFDLSIFAKLHRLMRGMKPDIVHSWASTCSLYLAPLAALTGTKFINGYIRDAPPRLTIADRNYLRGKLTTPFSDVIVANSQAGLKVYKVPTEKGVCIHNGFDLARLRHVDDPLSIRRTLNIDTPYIIGMVAAFSNRKDHECFFTLAKRITGLREDVTFVAVGEGAHLPSFRERFPENRFPRIRILGRRSDVEDIVNAFTIGALFSTRAEGMSNSIMEYMALGKPVIATKCPGNAELVETGRTGFLTENRDMDRLVNATLKLLDHLSLCHAFGEAGKRRIAGEFSLEKMTGAYLSLYHRLTGSNG